MGDIATKSEDFGTGQDNPDSYRECYQPTTL